MAKQSRRQSNTSCGEVPDLIQRGKTTLNVLFHPSKSLPSTLKGRWRSKGPPPATQQQQQLIILSQTFTRFHSISPPHAQALTQPLLRYHTPHTLED